LSNVTAYFTGETAAKETKKRAKRTHPPKKSIKSTTAAKPATSAKK